MSVAIEQIKPGAVFRFKTASRRVTGVNAGNVTWEYADGQKRGGRRSGTQWIHYFKSDAIEQIPDPAAAVESRKLLSGREVPSLAESIAVTLNTHCPAKWAVVDLETGELWGHDGAQFKHLSSPEAAEVVAVAKQAANK